MRTNLLLLSLLSLISTNIFAEVTKTVTLKMTESSSSFSNSTQIYFAPGTSVNFASPQDSKENFDTSLQTLVYTLTADNIACSSLGYGNLNTSVVVAIGYNVQQAGTFIFSASAGINLAPGSVIVLEDKTLGTFTDLMGHNDTVQIAETGQNQTRFYLHVSAPPVLTSIAIGCDNNIGIINIAEDTSVTWSSVLLFDSNNVTVQQLHYMTGAFSFSNLAVGKYQVAFFTASGYLFVDETEVTGKGVQISITSSDSTAEIGQNIRFFSTVSNNSLYTWTFGDSTIITGVANPSYDFSKDGSYQVMLSVINDSQCTAVAYLTISVGLPATTTAVVNTPDKDMNVYSYNKSVVITNNSLAVGNITYEIYNLAGQLIITAPVTSSNFTVSMDSQSAGIYLVQVKTENGSFTKKVYIG